MTHTLLPLIRCTVTPPCGTCHYCRVAAHGPLYWLGPTHWEIQRAVLLDMIEVKLLNGMSNGHAPDRKGRK